MMILQDFAGGIFISLLLLIIYAAFLYTIAGGHFPIDEWVRFEL